MERADGTRGRVVVAVWAIIKGPDQIQGHDKPTFDQSTSGSAASVRPV